MVLSGRDAWGGGLHAVNPCMTERFYRSCACSKHQNIVEARQEARDSFRRRGCANHNDNTQYRYPEHLLNIPPFAEWLESHVERMRREGFPLYPDLVRLSHPPSSVAKTWKYMYVRGCLQCQSRGGNIPSHTTYDCDVRRIGSEHEGSIEVGTLRQIVMVDYDQLKPELMKVAWVPRTVEGKSAVRKDRHGFWMCKLGEVDNSLTRNPFLYPSQVSPVFFMSDAQNPKWKVVLSYKPRTRRIVGEKKLETLGAVGAPTDSEGMLPSDFFPIELEAEIEMEDLEIPFHHVEAVNVGMRLPVQIDDIYGDDQYEDDANDLNEVP